MFKKILQQASLASVLFQSYAYADINDYVCGQGQETQTYATQDEMTVCLFFDNMDDNGTNVGGVDITPQKIVYSSKVDNFETF